MEFDKHIPGDVQAVLKAHGIHGKFQPSEIEIPGASVQISRLPYGRFVVVDGDIQVKYRTLPGTVQIEKLQIGDDVRYDPYAEDLTPQMPTPPEIPMGPKIELPEWVTGANNLVEEYWPNMFNT